MVLLNGIVTCFEFNAHFWKPFKFKQRKVSFQTPA